MQRRTEEEDTRENEGRGEQDGRDEELTVLSDGWREWGSFGSLPDL